MQTSPHRQVIVFGILLAVVVTGCAGQSPPAPTADRQSAPTSAPTVRKRITAGFMSNPPALQNRINAASAGGRSAAGIIALEEMLNTGLATPDDRGIPQPRLAETVPSVENGLWKVFPDGRMETTWTLRPGARWHDGTPVTSDDVVFTAKLGQDRSIPIERAVGYDLIERVEPLDARTVVVTWKQTYIDADVAFPAKNFSPAHLLAQTYTDDKASLVTLPYWTTDFVGTGPFRLREFVRDSHLMMEANDQYVLGRPKLDEIEIRFIPDANAFAASILAGKVELALGQHMSLEAALDLAGKWQNGKLDAEPSSAGNPMLVFPQLMNPNPAVISNVEFRRALLHAIDRQQLIDAFLAGRAAIAHGILWDPTSRGFAEVEPAIVRYDYDPARATRLLSGLGYQKGPDGMLVGPDGQRLSVEIRVLSSFDSGVKVLLPLADYWRQIGVAAEPLVVPEQRSADREYRATRPGYDMARTPRLLMRFHSANIPLPENNFVGDNRSRYNDPLFDAAIDRYFTTVPWDGRVAAIRQVVHTMTDQVTTMGLFFDVTPTVVANRIVHVRGGGVEGAQVWDAHEWDVRT